jgi:hypothetical protein
MRSLLGMGVQACYLSWATLYLPYSGTCATRSRYSRWKLRPEAHLHVVRGTPEPLNANGMRRFTRKGTLRF